ncbi:hypothetical protein [Streptomyces sp. NPDC088400]|uniref:hypothetical protein n=1 Tax=Streptomyces sp. NPDC088400 TaxID=3365861 RepID=UPI0038213B9B
MCGACGRLATGWPERVAPLGQGGTVARHRAVRRLLSGTRVTVRPWPGGGWQLADRAGRWRHCPDLEALWTTVRSVAGAVITPEPGDDTDAWTRPDAGTADVCAPDSRIPDSRIPDSCVPDPRTSDLGTAGARASAVRTPDPHALVVWTSAVLRAGPAPERLVVRAAGWRLTGAAGSAAVVVARCDGEGLTVEAPQGARSLADHLAAHLSELSVPPPGSR